MNKSNSVILLLFLCFTTMFQAQTIEIKVHNETLMYDTLRNAIENKRNYIKPLASRQKHCQISLETKHSYSDLYGGMFSKKKIQQLAKEKRTIAINVYCDSVGTILETRFSLWKQWDSIITWTEIYNLENALLGQQIGIKDTCPDVKYYFITLFCRFEKLYAEIIKAEVTQKNAK